MRGGRPFRAARFSRSVCVLSDTPTDPTTPRIPPVPIALSVCVAIARFEGEAPFLLISCNGGSSPHIRNVSPHQSQQHSTLFSDMSADVSSSITVEYLRAVIAA